MRTTAFLDKIGNVSDGNTRLFGVRRSKRSSANETPEPLPKLDSAVASRDVTARLIADVMAASCHPRSLSALVRLKFLGTLRDHLELRR